MLLKSSQILVVMLLLSLATAGYPFKKIKRIDELKIPYCIDQVGYRCWACGYDDEKQTFTAPNALNTACLPQVNGCLKYKDLKGLVCDGSAGCGCGFSRNFWGDCVPTPAGLQNCIEINKAGTGCVECVSVGTAQYGGGYSDYGLSNDKKQCLDNTVLSKNFCAIYKVGDAECAKCKQGYAFNASNACIQLVDDQEDNCELANDQGVCLKCIINAPYNTVSGRCATPSAVANCALYDVLPNSKLDDVTTCIQCNPGYIIGAAGCRWIYDATAVSLDGTETNSVNLGVLGRWCLGIVKSHYFQVDSQWKQACAVPWSRLGEYRQGILPALDDLTTYVDPVDNVNTYCRTSQVDKLTFKCPTSGDCLDSQGNAALFWETNTGRCYRIQDKVGACTAVTNCLEADAFGKCTKCHPGFDNSKTPKCEAIPDTAYGCKEFEADGVTCKACEHNYVSVSGYLSVRLFLRLNPITKKCQSVATPDPNCQTYDATFLCTECWTGYQIVDGDCQLAADVDTPQAPYGCKVFSVADSKCTEALNGFWIDKNTNKAQPIDTTKYCLKWVNDDPTNDCQTCIHPEYYKVYDIFTKQWSRCARDNSLSGNAGCAKRFNNCANCEDCKATYSQYTRDGTPAANFGSDTGCYRSVSDPGNSYLAGCVVHTDATNCATCGFGYLLTTDKQCFSLYGRRTSSTTEGRLSNSGSVNLSDLIPEPCTGTPSTELACVACQSQKTFGADVGLKKFSAGFFSDAKARAFCIYNAQDLSIQGTNATPAATTLDFDELNYCKEYKEETTPDTGFNECTATQFDGYTIDNGIPTNKATTDGTEFGLLAKSCQPGSIVKNAGNWQCSTCNPYYILNTTTKLCSKISSIVANCRASGSTYTGLQSDVACDTCRAGYLLAQDSTATNKNTIEQCHEINNLDISGCGTYYCATKTITVTWDTTNTLSSPLRNQPQRAVGDCAAGYEQKSDRCVPTTALITNCAQFVDNNGACQSCADGYTLVDIQVNNNAQVNDLTRSRSNLFNLRCVNTIPNCINYDGSANVCKACGVDPVTGRKYFLDDEKSSCLEESVWRTTGCAQFDRVDSKKCLKCKPNRGVPTDGCLLNAPICQTWKNDFPDVCHECPDNYKLNYQFQCVRDLFALLDFCDVAYNSTTCINCASGKALIVNQDNDEASDIGLCGDSDQISNCVIVSADGTKCYRCKSGYAWIAGACVQNPLSDPLSQCAEYKYDTDKKQLYCSECRYGYAIDGNYTTCILNTHNCTDISGGNDCSQITLLQPFSQTFECDEYRSSSILVSFSLLLSIIFYIFL